MSDKESLPVIIARSRQPSFRYCLNRKYQAFELASIAVMLGPSASFGAALGALSDRKAGHVTLRTIVAAAGPSIFFRPGR